MALIFASQSSSDNAAAKALPDWLAVKGGDHVFLDFGPAPGIVPGERWERALHAAASSCDVAEQRCV